MARAGSPDAVHRAGKSLGERLCGVLQREAAGRAVGEGDLLHAQGGPGTRGAMEEAVQSGSTAQRAGISSPGAAGGGPGTGPDLSVNLRFGMDRLPGAGQTDLSI